MSERAAERERSDRTEAGERREGAGEGLVDRQDAPTKRHGDALEHGSGNRHGVHEREKAPDTCG